MSHHQANLMTGKALQECGNRPHFMITHLVEVDCEAALPLRSRRFKTLNARKEPITHSENGSLRRHKAANLSHEGDNTNAFEVDGLPTA